MSMFKVGDKVVRTIGHNVVFEVSGGCIGGRNVNARKNGEVYTDYISTTKGMPHHKSQLRHATPEEIAAGHRIESSNDQAISNCSLSNLCQNDTQNSLPIKQENQDMGDDSHIENHVSPNCKVRVK